jgi:GT2 family glycosyltransferase
MPSFQADQFLQKSSTSISHRLALIVPSYRRTRALVDTLLRLKLLQPQPDELWVMEQSNPADSLVKKACEELKTKVYLHQDLPPSAQKARNLAAQATRADILLFLDDDVEPETDLVRTHLENYQDPSIHAVAGFYLEPGDCETSQPRKAVWWKPLTKLEKYPSSHTERVDSYLWPSCNGSIRRETFLKMGGFDENYIYTFLDDTDLSIRMQKAGYRCVHDPKARLFHRKEPTGGNRPVKPGDRVIANREKWYTWFYFFWMNYGLLGLGEILFRMRTNVFRRPYFLKPDLLFLAIGEMTIGFGHSIRSILGGRKLMSARKAGV